MPRCSAANSRCTRQDERAEQYAVVVSDTEGTSYSVSAAAHAADLRSGSTKPQLLRARTGRNPRV